MNDGLNRHMGDTERLGRVVFQYSLFNLFVLSIVGIYLRSIPVTNIGVSYYKNIVHAHSHFAFGGWIMPGLLAVQVKYYPELVMKISYKHWRNISALLLFSAYGMLLSFPFQGYGPVSIIFSTLSILASFYLAFVTWRAKTGLTNNTSLRFLSAGLFYLVISSIGPFATAPLIIMGKAGTTIYFDAIYFYLHFQYNGWFSFILLGVFYKIIGENRNPNGRKVFILMNVSCIPAYFLSTLWSHPSSGFYIIGGSAAVLQVLSLFYLLKDVSMSRRFNQRLHWLIYMALVIFSVKLILQLIAAFRIAADLAYAHRNFIIFYLHLVLLGYVTLFIMGAMADILVQTALSRKAISLFIVTWIISEVTLVLQALGEVFLIPLPGFEKTILGVSSLFPIILFFLWSETRRKKQPGSLP